MPVHNAAVRRSIWSPRSLNVFLLAGVSTLTLLSSNGARAGALVQALASRGGTSASSNATATATLAAQQAATVTAQVTTDLSKSISTLRATLAAQAVAASAAAAASTSVTDGLSAGGLIVDPRVGTTANLWANISAPVETVANGQYTETLTQSSARAVATWEQFNIGKNTTVHFDQSAGNTTTGNSWIVLNRIDAAGVPSQIQGKIKAEGTVLLINPNGIIFSGTSQVNVHSLIAAAMDINGYKNSNYGVFNGSGSYTSYTAASGVTFEAPANEASANGKFLTSGLYLYNSGQLFLSAPSSGAVGTNVGVQVEAGAQIVSTVSGNDNGGLVALLGPTVTNAGSITVPAGQVILAAGNNLGLAEPATTTAVNLSVVPAAEMATGLVSMEWTSSNSLGALGAVATNAANGLLASERGNVTLFGDTVQQLGAIDVTTSITRAGSIVLRAVGGPTGNNFLTSPTSDAGSVIFGPDSVTRILPDENGETIPGNSTSAFTLPSIAILNAADVDFQSGSLVLAPGASFTISGIYGAPSITSSGPWGRVLLEAGSTIDLAGTSATVSLASYLHTFKVTTNDVADSPLAQNLIGKTVTIDLTQTGTRTDGETWIGSPLFASSGAGYYGDITKSIDQLLTKGGTFTVSRGTGLSNFSDLIQEPGSLINVSGGAILYSGATITTTNLLAANGRIYNIGSADPFVGIVGIAGTTTITHHVSTGGTVTETYTNRLAAISSYDDPGYTDGISAGGVSVTAVDPILEGTIEGDIVIGAHQRALAQTGTGTDGAQTTFDQLPLGASLAINLAIGNFYGDEVVLAEQAPEALPSGFDFLTAPFLNATDSRGHALAGTLPVDAYGLPIVTYSTAALSADNFGSITIKGAALLSMEAGATLSVRPGGSVTLADVATIDGTIVAHGGTITLAGFKPTNTTTNGNPSATVFPITYQNLVLGPDALLDVSGLWVNDSGANTATLIGKADTSGGSVSITTYALSTANGTIELTNNGIDTGSFLVDAIDKTASIILEQGSVVDLSSGGYVKANGQIALGANGLPAGTGGSLSLLTYAGAVNVGWNASVIADAYRNQVDTSSNGYAPVSATAATVVMDGTITAGGLATGGSFSLRAPAIVIDGTATSVSSATAGSAAGTVTLPAGFFQGGFSTYNLTSTFGSITVTPGTTVLLRQQDDLVSTTASLPATGAALQSFATLGTLPDGERQPTSLTLTEIPVGYGTIPSGVSVGGASATAGIVIGQGASIVADPQAAITLTAGQSLDVLGDLTAHGGAITLAGALDTWIGSGAVLDVSGTFVPNPLVTTYRTGTELAGGSITFGLSTTPTGYSGNGVVIVESGAVLDLAGGSATVQLPIGQGRFGAGGATLQTLWSDGGTLAFLGGNGLFLGGTINAAGGAAQAAGGTIDVGDIVLSSTFTNGYGNLPYAIVLTQGGDVSAPFLGASAPATAAALSKLLTQAGATSAAAVTADTLSGSGFSTVFLDGGSIGFAGNVSLTGLKELDLAGPLVLPSSGGAVVTLGANYIRLFGYSKPTSAKLPDGTPTLQYGQISLAAGDGRLTLSAAQQIDIEGAVGVSGAATVTLSSDGDIRLIWADGGTLSTPLVTTTTETNGSTVASPTLSATSLIVPDSLTLIARELYTATDTAGVLLSLGRGSRNTITIASNGATPYAPLSAGGSLVVDAPTIIQNGVLYAPLGTIQLGVTASEPMSSSDFFAGLAPATTSVTLGAGSLTSVSLAGLDVPYGNTINGVWQITSLPAKEIILSGANVVTQTGAVLDLSGGGDVYATEFVAGTGGSRNVLTTTAQIVYALVPSGESTVAAPFPTAGYTLTSWSGVTGSDAVRAFSLQAGMTVTLPGGNGIAGGTYVLMPAMYATLPGAYRVVVTPTTVNAAVSAVAPDGTVYTTGVFGNAVTGETSPQTALLEIQSKAVWSRYSEIDLSSANSAFTSTAATNGTATPRLPIDAGHLVLAATASLSVDASNRFVPGAASESDGTLLSGRGGMVDITGTDLLVVAADQAASTAANPSGAIVLDADQLSRLGAASLLIGGVRSTTTSGVLITPTALDLQVATDAAHPLTAPDLFLVTTGSITGTSATTKVTVGSGNQTVTIASGLAGIAAGAGITLYDASSLDSGSALNWVHGTVSSYDPATGSLTFAGATASGSESQIGSATVLIATPSLGSGLAVADGSVVKAVGTVPAGSSQAVTIGANPAVTNTNGQTGAVLAYTPGASGDGVLLRVSNGDPITVSRPFVPGLYSTSTLSVAFGPVATAPEGQLAVGAATLSGNSIILDSSGTNSLSAVARLAAADYTLTASQINLGGTNPSGLTLSPAILAEMAGAQSVLLSSYSVFNFYGTEAFGASSAPIGRLTFDGSGLVSDGGTVSVAAGNVVFQDSQASGIASQAGGSGALSVTASGSVTVGAGGQTWNGFSQVALTAASEMLFTGSGAVTAKAADVTITTPAVVADTDAVQALSTSGTILLAPTGGALPTLASTTIGGSLTLTGGAISVSNAILAPGGAITLEAKTGDVTLNAGARLSAQGSRIVLFGLLDEDVAGGTIKLIADAANVTVGQGATVDVSAAGNGYAGTVSIAAASGAATLDGAILGAAAYKDLGGTFILNADTLKGSLPTGASFSNATSVTLGHGDITLGATDSISSGTILLVANDGSVTINGTLDASGPSGGTISVYGAGTYDGSSVSGGVSIGSTAKLIARYQADDAADPATGNGESALTQNGGTITLGTSGIGSTTHLDPNYGYEIVLPSLSGWVRVAPGAVFDVSGGLGGANISNTGGTVYIRAPIVEAPSFNSSGQVVSVSGQAVNVDFNGTIVTNADANGGPSGKGLVLQAYATWSTADQQSDITKYFDSIIDPAGWYSSSGTLVAGTFTDVSGNQLATWNGAGVPSVSTITSQVNPSILGTQVLTVAAGLGLTVGETVYIQSGDGGSNMSGTVVSYDNATGALVLKATSGVVSSASTLTVLYNSNGLFIPSYAQIGDPDHYYGGYLTDSNGVPYFDLTNPFSANQPITAGEAMTLEMQGITFRGTVKGYYTANGGGGATDWHLAFYSPSLVAAFKAGDFWNNGRFGSSADYFSFGSTPANAAVSTTQTQALTIGTGTKVLTILPALTYISGEAITLTDTSILGNPSITGTITSYNATTGALVLNVTADTGAGTATGIGDTWDFAVTLPQSIVNSYLANDYFTPSTGSTNAAHQTFYGFVNGDATAAAGTLMSFVQNPFAGNDTTALAGLSGAKIQIGATGTPQSLSAAQALHVSPEIDLINPSTGVNGGNISVLSDWNLGAGNSPTSLYYRYNGSGTPWAPTLTLRAANNINLDASITDGFFQKVATVGGYSLPTGESYSSITGSSAYKSELGFSNGLSSYDFGGGLVPGAADYAAMDLQNPVTFTGEGTGSVDVYYNDYKQYVTAWSNFYENTLGTYNNDCFATVSNGGKILVDDNGGKMSKVINALNNANSLYSSTDLSSYGAYLTAYNVYVTAYYNWTCCVAPATLPVAPLPPPKISSPVPPTILPLVNNGPAPVRTPTDQSPIAGMDLVAEASSSTYKFVAGAAFRSVEGNIVATVNPEAMVSTGSLGSTDANGVTLTGNVTFDGHISYANTAFSASVWDNATSSWVTYSPRIDVPTIIRTGTGSIDLIAAGSIEWLDTLSPAAVYTAGTVAANATDFTQPTLSASYTNTPNGLLSTPTWATGGGEVTLSAGRDIVGIETPVDSELVATVKGTTGAQTLGDNTPSMAQVWSTWYIPLGASIGETATPFNTADGGVQNSAYINYATFYQGVGALGGGNVTVSAGRNVYDLSVSLPETIQVSGGRFAGDSAATAHYYGGGDLSVTIGGNLYSSTFYVGRGTGLIRVAGSVEVDAANPITGLETGVYGASWVSYTNKGGFNDYVPVAYTDAYDYTALPLLLAEQDSYITVEAGGSIALGGVFQPTRLPGSTYPYYPLSMLPSGAGGGFDSYGAGSGVTLIAAGGDVSIVDAFPATLSWAESIGGIKSGFGLASANLLPATLEAISVAGNLTIGNTQSNIATYVLYPSADGTLILAAGQTLSTTYDWGVGSGAAIDFNTVQMADATTFGGVALYDILGTPTPSTLSAPLHADDSTSALILAGQDIIGDFQLIKQATMEAGRDILDTVFIGQNNGVGDVTSIIAGRDIRSTNVFDGVISVIGNAVSSPGGTTAPAGASLFELYGPGDFLVSAGRNLGPFLVYPYSDVGGGIFAVGNGSNLGTGGTLIPYLPVAGANVTALFGVDGGIDYAAAIAAYVTPANAGTAGIDYRPLIAQQLVQQVGRQFSQLVTDTEAGAFSQTQLTQLNQILTAAGFKPLKPADLQAFANLATAARANPLTPSQLAQLAQLNTDLTAAGLSAVTPDQLAKSVLPSVSLTSGEAVAVFQELSARQQDRLVDRAFLDFLTQVSLDYNNPSSSYYNQDARAYDTIATLFPSSLGYTQNNTGEGKTASVTVHTGDLWMARSRVETQTGGDIDILGPGGSIIVGNNQADNVPLSQEGILTLQGGSIRAYVDKDVQVYQSRVFTEQGGDVDMFSANGDLNAGKGPKSSASYPPLQVLYDTDGYESVNPAGLVTGAGIGALLSIPGQDPTKSNDNLMAPHGTVDAGAAGIRAAGNINIVALHVANAFNMEAGGTITGVPVAAMPNLGALTAASDTAGAASATADAASRSSRQTGPRNQALPSIITVEVIGYGGGDGTPKPDDKARKDEEERRRKVREQHSYNPNSAFEVVGAGPLTDEQKKSLTDAERWKLAQP